MKTTWTLASAAKRSQIFRGQRKKKQNRIWLKDEVTQKTTVGCEASLARQVLL